MNSNFRLILVVLSCFLIGAGLGFFSFRRAHEAADGRSSRELKRGKWAAPVLNTDPTQKEPSEQGRYESPAEAVAGLCEDSVHTFMVACYAGEAGACLRAVSYFASETSEHKAVLEKLFSICESESSFSSSSIRFFCQNILSLNRGIDAALQDKPSARISSLCDQGKIGACELILSTPFNPFKEKALQKVFSLCELNDFEACKLLVRNETEALNIDKLGGRTKKYFSLCEAGVLQACADFVSAQMGGSPELPMALEKIVNACSSPNPPKELCVRALDLYDFKPAQRDKAEAGLLALCIAGDAEVCKSFISVVRLADGRREAATKKIHSLCDEKNVEACIWVAESSKTSDSQRQHALEVLQQSCEAKHPKACFFLGNLYSKNCPRGF